jgi:hypothetical protein
MFSLYAEEHSFQSRITGQTILIYSYGKLNGTAAGEVAMAFDTALQKIKTARSTLRLDCALDEYYKDSVMPTGMILKDAAKKLFHNPA